jgi:hypothetical protein
MLLTPQQRKNSGTFLVSIPAKLNWVVAKSIDFFSFYQRSLRDFEKLST